MTHISQVLIVLSTGEYNTMQLISLVTSVLSLSWGAARSFLIMRPADKADPNPEAMTILLSIWPWMLVCNALMLMLPHSRIFV